MSKVSDYILPIGILAAIAIIIYVIYSKLKDNPITQAVGGAIDTAPKVIDVLTKPGINFVPGLENVDVPHLITTPGYELIGDALKDVSLPEITLPSIDMRPGYQIIGDMINPPKATTSTVTTVKKNALKSSERDVIPVSAINVNVPSKVAAKIKAGKIF